MSYTIPADSHLVGDTGHTGYHNNISDVINGSVPFNILNTAYSGGADPTGVADSSAAINAAIAAAASGGGVVRVPPGSYKVSAAAIQMSSGVILAGDGPAASILKPTGSNNGVNVTSASAMADVGITGIQVQGPGSGTGIGILASANSGALRVERLKVANVVVTGMGSHGAELDNTIMSVVDQCKAVGNGARGLYQNGGTTLRVSNSWFTGNTAERGFYANAVIATTLIACGSDSNAIGYEWLNSSTCAMVGCDVSGTVAAGGLDGTSIKINGCFGLLVQGSFIANNRAVGLWVTNASGGIQAFGINETAGAGATASIKTDSGTDLAVNGANLATATSYAANTLVLIAGSYSFFSNIEVGTSLFDGLATVNGGAKFGAGSTSLAPVQLTAGTNLTTAAAGATEFDGTVFYDTAAASSRQVRDTEQLITLTSTYTLTSQTAAQKLFNATANGALTVAASTTYFFECFYSLSAMSASSGAFGFALGGTATLTSQTWETEGNKAVLATAASPQNTVNTAANTAIVTATTATVGWARVRGKIRVNAAGTLIPQVSLGVAAAAVVGADSYFRIWPAGASAVTSVGNWS